MSRPLLNRSQLMERLVAEDFVKKFPQAYILDPKLTPEKFYEILRSVKFDIKEAQLKVIELVRIPGEFIIPAGLTDVEFPTPPLSSPPTPQVHAVADSGPSNSSSTLLPSIEEQNSLLQLPSPESAPHSGTLSPAPIQDLEAESDDHLRKEKSSNQASKTAPKRQAPAEDSDDEILAPAFRSKRNKLVNKSTAPTTPTAPHPTLDNSRSKRTVSNAFSVSMNSDSSDENDEPPRAATRRSRLRDSPFQQVAQTIRELSLNPRVEQQPTRQSTIEALDHNGVELEHYTSPEVRRPPCQRGFSATPDFGDESEYEVPSENEELRDITPDYWPTTPPELLQRHGSSSSDYFQGRKNISSTIWVTPLIAHLWKKWYPDSLEEVPVASPPISHLPGKSLKDELQELRDQVRKHANSSIGEIKLRGLIKHDRKLDRRYFASADIDGVRYVPGDYVMVASQGEMREDAAETEVGTAEDPWFAQIIFIFQDEHDEKLVHLKWFEHGARTLLGETASSRELFLFQSCDDNPLGCIIKKIHVNFVPTAADTHYDMESVDAGVFEEGDYFYRQYWHPESRSFTQATPSQAGTNDNGQPDFCECCQRKSEKLESQKSRILGDITTSNGRATVQAFVLEETTYRLHDFVYIVDGRGEAYQIGQIAEIYVPRGTASGSKSQARSYLESKLISLRIAAYKRYDDLLPSVYEEIESNRKHVVRDSRRLFATGETRLIAAVDLDGKCYVFHREHLGDLDGFKDQRDTFWVQDRLSTRVNPESSIRLRDLRSLDPEDMNYSAQSKLDLFNKVELREDFMNYGKKPRTLELFNGIGGLTVAFKDICGKTNAVEIDEAACHTMSTNQPNATVHHCDASVLLIRAIRRDQGEDLEPIFDRHGNLIHDLPRRGEVDFIKGGPPCPGFSGANCHKRVAEHRNGLVALFLAYVHFYQPKYSLIENVVGLIRHNLVLPQEPGDAKVEIQNGTIKMIFRTFTSMGYQVQCAILNTEEHGAPQLRSRVLIWATLPGYKLPAYPQPEHVSKSRAISPLFEADRKLGTYDYYWHRQRRSAPHRVVTLGDTFTDLPAFDWKNPHLVVEKTRSVEQQEQERWERISLYDPFEADTAYVGRNDQSYSSGPLTEYQRSLRADNTSDIVNNHVTAKLPALNTERVCSLPLRPGASYKDLPQDLRSNRNPPDNACARLDLNGIQNVCMTKMEVLGKYGKVIHPTQHRIESIREYARVQGFPDTYVFDLDNWTVADAIRGIGNAVPIPLGRSIAEGFLDSWMEHVNTPSDISGGSRDSKQQTATDSNGRTGSSKADAIDLVSDDEE